MKYQYWILAHARLGDAKRYYFKGVKCHGDNYFELIFTRNRDEAMRFECPSEARETRIFFAQAHGEAGSFVVEGCRKFL